VLAQPLELFEDVCVFFDRAVSDFLEVGAQVAGALPTAGTNRFEPRLDAFAVVVVLLNPVASHELAAGVAADVDRERVSLVSLQDAVEREGLAGLATLTV
jgi:hypothetical protein